MTRLQVCDGEVHSLLCKGQCPGICQLQGTSRSREEPGKWGQRESSKKRSFGLYWLLLASPDQIPPENTDGLFFFIKAHELRVS